jgi:hypothetical protein
MKLCTYVMAYDFGFAPNPFGDYCTLAACTPNHCRVNLDEGDWLAGHSSAKTGQRLIYAMEVLEVLDLNFYYRDERFQYKKPRFDRTLQEACGDNLYYRNEDGTWGRHKSGFHPGQRHQEQDKKGNRVFIANHFYYFGKESEELPLHLTGIIRKGPSCKCDHPEELVRGFVDWVQASYTPGACALPRDFDQSADYLPQGCKDVCLDIDNEKAPANTAAPADQKASLPGR